MLERWEVGKHGMTFLHSLFHGRNHVAVGRHHNRYVAVLAERIGHNLRGNPHVRLLFLVSVVQEIAVLALELLPQILPKNQFALGFAALLCKELRAQLISLEESVLSQAFPIILHTGREILHRHQLLIRAHERLEQLHHIQPVILSPAVLPQPIVEVEPVNIHNDLLLIHISFAFVFSKNKPTFLGAGGPRYFPPEGDFVLQR